MTHEIRRGESGAEAIRRGESGPPPPPTIIRTTGEIAALLVSTDAELLMIAQKVGVELPTKTEFADPGVADSILDKLTCLRILANSIWTKTTNINAAL